MPSGVRGLHDENGISENMASVRNGERAAGVRLGVVDMMAGSSHPRGEAARCARIEEKVHVVPWQRTGTQLVIHT